MFFWLTCHNGHLHCGIDDIFSWFSKEMEWGGRYCNLVDFYLNSVSYIKSHVHFHSSLIMLLMPADGCVERLNYFLRLKEVQWSTVESQISILFNNSLLGWINACNVSFSIHIQMISAWVVSTYCVGKQPNCGHCYQLLLIRFDVQ